MKSKLLLTTKTWKEGKYFVAYNPELDVASQGNTLSEAQENLREAVSLFIETTRKMGTLKQALQEAGFLVKNKKEYQLPELFFSSFEVTI